MKQLFYLLKIGSFIILFLWVAWLLTLDYIVYYLIEFFVIMEFLIGLYILFKTKFKIKTIILCVILLLNIIIILNLNRLIILTIENRSGSNIDSIELYNSRGEVFFTNICFLENDYETIIRRKTDMGGYFKIMVKSKNKQNSFRPYFIGFGNAQPHFDTLSINKNLQCVQYWRVLSK